MIYDSAFTRHTMPKTEVSDLTSLQPTASDHGRFISSYGTGTNSPWSHRMEVNLGDSSKANAA